MLGAPYPYSALLAATLAGPRGPTLRLEYAAGSAAIEKSTIVLDSSHNIHISHARDRDGSKVSPHRLEAKRKLTNIIVRGSTVRVFTFILRAYTRRRVS